MHLGSLSEGDPGDVANAEPQRQSSAQLGLRHGKEAPQGGRPGEWTFLLGLDGRLFVCGSGQLD